MNNSHAMNTHEVRDLLAEIRAYYSEADPVQIDQNSMTNVLPVLVEVTQRLIEERDELQARLTRRFVFRTPLEAHAN